MTRYPYILVTLIPTEDLEPMPSSARLIKTVFAKAIDDQQVDWDHRIVCEVFFDELCRLFVFERIRYGAHEVVECDGVVVHHFSDTPVRDWAERHRNIASCWHDSQPARPRLGAEFEKYRRVRDSYDELANQPASPLQSKLKGEYARAIENIEERNPDFRQAYEDARDDQEG